MNDIVASIDIVALNLLTLSRQIHSITISSAEYFSQMNFVYTLFDDFKDDTHLLKIVKYLPEIKRGNKINK